MQIDDSDTVSLDPSFLDADPDRNLDYGTPRLATDSQGWPVPGGRDLSRASGPSLTYSVVWKLQLRKGRMMTLTGDTVEDVKVAPGAYWIDAFKSEIENVVNEKVPEPLYKPDETRIAVSTSKRAERDFQKRFTGLNIDWVPVENKLAAWTNQKDRLTLDICFIFKEVPVDSTNKVGKSGRGATGKHLAARDRYIAQQEAAGIRPVWKGVYELLSVQASFVQIVDFPAGGNRRVKSTLSWTQIRWKSLSNLLKMVTN